MKAGAQLSRRNPLPSQLGDIREVTCGETITAKVALRRPSPPARRVVRSPVHLSASPSGDIVTAKAAAMLHDRRVTSRSSVALARRAQPSLAFYRSS